MTKINTFKKDKSLPSKTYTLADIEVALDKLMVQYLKILDINNEDITNSDDVVQKILSENKRKQREEEYSFSQFIKDLPPSLLAPNCEVNLLKDICLINYSDGPRRLEVSKIIEDITNADKRLMLGTLIIAVLHPWEENRRFIIAIYNPEKNARNLYYFKTDTENKIPSDGISLQKLINKEVEWADLYDNYYNYHNPERGTISENLAKVLDDLKNQNNTSLNDEFIAFLNKLYKENCYHEPYIEKTVNIVRQRQIQAVQNELNKNPYFNILTKLRENNKKLEVFEPMVNILYQMLSTLQKLEDHIATLKNSAKKSFFQKELSNGYFMMVSLLNMQTQLFLKHEDYPLMLDEPPAKAIITAISPLSINRQALNLLNEELEKLNDYWNHFLKYAKNTSNKVSLKDLSNSYSTLTKKNNNPYKNLFMKQCGDLLKYTFALVFLCSIFSFTIVTSLEKMILKIALEFAMLIISAAYIIYFASNCLSTAHKINKMYTGTSTDNDFTLQMPPLEGIGALLKAYNKDMDMDKFFNERQTLTSQTETRATQQISHEAPVLREKKRYIEHDIGEIVWFEEVKESEEDIQHETRINMIDDEIQPIDLPNSVESQALVDSHQMYLYRNASNESTPLMFKQSSAENTPPKRNICAIL